MLIVSFEIHTGPKKPVNNNNSKVLTSHSKFLGHSGNSLSRRAIKPTAKGLDQPNNRPRTVNCISTDNKTTEKDINPK